MPSSPAAGPATPRFLAQKLAEALPAQDCVFAGAPGQTLPDADLIFVGFWTDKGDCPPDAAAFLARLQGKRVFLFGTAGFGGSQQYFAEILGRVRAHLDASNTVAGQFMCQGRMPPGRPPPVRGHAAGAGRADAAKL